MSDNLKGFSTKHLCQSYIFRPYCVFLFLPSTGSLKPAVSDRVKFELIGTKAEPIKNFNVSFYSTKDFDLSGERKVIRIKNEGGGWNFYPPEKDAEKFIAGKLPFDIYSLMFEIATKKKPVQ